MRIVFSVLLVFLFVLPTTLQAQTNLVVNGSFEDPVMPINTPWLVTAIPGWSVTGCNGEGEIQRGITGVLGETGKQWAELDAACGNVTISQDISTIVGQRYVIRFRTAIRPPADPGSRVEFLWNYQTRAFVIPGSSAFAQSEFEVVALFPVSRLAFRGAGTSNGFGDLLDDVEVLRIGGVGDPFGYKYYLPQYAVGDGWTTSMMITSENGPSLTYMWTTYDNNGTIRQRPGLNTLATDRTNITSLGQGGTSVVTGWIEFETSATCRLFIANGRRAVRTSKQRSRPGGRPAAWPGFSITPPVIRAASLSLIRTPWQSGWASFFGTPTASPSEPQPLTSDQWRIPVSSLIRCGRKLLTSPDGLSLKPWRSLPETKQPSYPSA